LLQDVLCFFSLFVGALNLKCFPDLDTRFAWRGCLACVTNIFNSLSSKDVDFSAPLFNDTTLFIYKKKMLIFLPLYDWGSTRHVIVDI
jgi:hypothetical protein